MQDLQQLMYATASKLFGITTIKPYQNLVIRTILENDLNQSPNPRGHLVIFPTGYGKSLCFLLPAAILNGVTLIIYPLLALMADQKRHLERTKMGVEVIQGGQTKTQRSLIWQRLGKGDSKIIITNPETLNSKSVLGRIKQLNPKLLVIDEAHVVSQWGKTFRPSYLKLQQAILYLKPRQVLAFTATASESMIKNLQFSLFEGRKPHMVVADPDRSNIYYSTVRTLSKTQSLIQILRYCEKQAIIFTRTRLDTIKLFWKLKAQIPELNCRFYHAGLSKPERHLIEQWFLSSPDAVMVATTAYGLGMDVPSVRTVIHHRIPNTIEEFLQESGRAGRDSLDSTSYTLIDFKDLTSKDQNPQRRALLDALIQQTSCLRSALLCLLAKPPEHCSGCDICDGSFQGLPEEMAIILEVVKRYPFRYGIDQLSTILSAQFPYSPALRTSLYWGRLSGWTYETVKEAVETLVRHGHLSRMPTGLKTFGLFCTHPFSQPRFQVFKKNLF